VLYSYDDVCICMILACMVVGVAPYLEIIGQNEYLVNIALSMCCFSEFTVIVLDFP
jgi:hypothetical protein